MLNDVIRQSHPSPRTSQRSEDAIKAIVYHELRSSSRLRKGGDTATFPVRRREPRNCRAKCLSSTDT